MRYLRQTGNPNITVGIFLLIMLAFFAGPNALPRLVGSVVPFADEGVPCQWLRRASERESHQSLIGRAASTVQGRAPVSVQIIAQPIPNVSTGEWVLKVILSNNAIGTIPVILNPSPSIGDNGQVGLGVIFNSTVPVGDGAGQPVAANNIRLLGPRQRCVERIVIPAQMLPNYNISANSTVKAYYRNTGRGELTQFAGALYPDQGLWVGVVESETIIVSMAAAPAPTQ